jgi:hypothetical protein
MADYITYVINNALDEFQVYFVNPYYTIVINFYRISSVLQSVHAPFYYDLYSIFSILRQVDLSLFLVGNKSKNRKKPTSKLDAE